MRFENIPKANVQDVFGHVHSSNEFYRFVRDFNVIAVKWSQPTNISASYFREFYKMDLLRGHVDTGKAVETNMMSHRLS